MIDHFRKWAFIWLLVLLLFGGAIVSWHDSIITTHVDNFIVNDNWKIVWGYGNTNRKTIDNAEFVAIYSLKEAIQNFRSSDIYGCDTIMTLKPTWRHLVLFQKCNYYNYWQWFIGTLYKHIIVDYDTLSFERFNGWDYQNNIDLCRRRKKYNNSFICKEIKIK